MAKNDGSKKKSMAGGVIGGGLAAALVLFFLGGGSSLFNGGGTGILNGGTGAEETAAEAETAESTVEESGETSQTQAQAADVTITISGEEYRIDGNAVTLDEIRTLLTEDGASENTYTLKDDYGSEKAWTELEALFTGLNIGYTEE